MSICTEPDCQSTATVEVQNDGYCLHHAQLKLRQPQDREAIAPPPPQEATKPRKKPKGV